MSQPVRLGRANPNVGYAAPFVVYVALMALERAVGLPLGWFYPIRLLLVAATLLVFSRPYLSLRPQVPLGSLGIGIVVFFIWIGPDLLFGPQYRHHWLFENSLTGGAIPSVTGTLQVNTMFILVRILGSVVLVPILEELFWRGWLMRWLVEKEFLKVPLGAYLPSAFWTVAVLFASEHGSYWEVGLAAGVIYNWWLIRTKSLADCMLAHAVTNGLLAAYVVGFDQWQYWI